MQDMKKKSNFKNFSEAQTQQQTEQSLGENTGGTMIIHETVSQSASYISEKLIKDNEKLVKKVKNYEDVH